MPIKIVVYASPFCPYCQRAQALLDSKGADYKVLDVNENPVLWDELSHRTGRMTVPQIFIGDRYIGGCDDLFALDRAGGLDPLLNDSAN